MQYLTVLTLAGWLGIAFGDAVAANSNLASVGSEVQTEVQGESALSVGSWTTGDLHDYATVTANLPSDHHANAGMSAGFADSAAPKFPTTISSEESPYLLAPKTIQSNVAPERPSPQRSNVSRRRPLHTFGAAAILFIACLGLLAGKYMGAFGDKKKEEQPQPEQQQQATNYGDLTKQLNDLEDMHPLAVWLTKVTNSRESRSALLNFCKSMEQAKQVQGEVSAGSWDSVNSPPEAVMQEALENGISELSRLVEAAREHGLFLVQRALTTPSPAQQWKQGLNTLSGVDLPAAASLAFYFERLDFSCTAFKRHAEKVEEELQSLPVFKGAEDAQVLRAVAAEVELAKTAYEVVDMGWRSTMGLESTAKSLVMSRFAWKQMRIYRECRDCLQERLALCSAERERQKSLPQEDTAALEELDAVQNELETGRRLLDAFKAEIEQLQKRRDIESAQPAIQLTEELGQEIKTLLEEASIHMRSIGDIANAEEALNGGMRTRMKAAASRASEEAAVVGRRVADILMEADLGAQLLYDTSEMTQADAPGSSVSKAVLDPSLLKKVTESLQQLEEDAKTAARDFSTAAVGPAMGSSQAVGMETIITDNLARKADELLLQAQLLESAELDLRLSSRLSDRMASLVGAGALDPPAGALGVLELSSPRKREFEATLDKVKGYKDMFNSLQDSGEIVEISAAMKGAVLSSVGVVEQELADSNAQIKY